MVTLPVIVLLLLLLLEPVPVSRVLVSIISVPDVVLLLVAGPFRLCLPILISALRLRFVLGSCPNP